MLFSFLLLLDRRLLGTSTPKPSKTESKTENKAELYHEHAHDTAARKTGGVLIIFALYVVCP